MGPLLPSLVLLALLAGPARAQGFLARTLERRAAEVERGSEAWFRLSFEAVEAELRVDVGAAQVAAEALLGEARARGDGELVALAAALANLTLATLEGPARKGEWHDLAGATPSPSAPAWQRALHALLRSRNHCQESELGDELAAALTGAAAARESGDPFLRALAAQVVWHVTHDSAETFYEDLQGEIAALVAHAELTPYRPRLLLLQYEDSLGEYTLDERRARLAEIELLAREQEDLAALGRVAWARSDIALEADDGSEAMHQLESAADLFARQGERRDRAFSFETAADVAIARHLHAEAHDYLARAAELIEGRGFRTREGGILRSRFDLALSEKDSATVLALTDRLEALAREEEEEQRAYVPLRDQLLSAERLRVAAERDLAEEREHMAVVRESSRRVVLIGTALGLLLLSGLVLRSRQRLLRANRHLAAEKERAERESVARRELEQRMRAIERSESLGLVAGGVAHDFNNLMVGVLGNADLLLQAEQDPARRELLRSITAAGQRAARLCKQLQAYAGDGPEARELLCLGRLAEELAPVLRTAAGERVRFELRTLGNLPAIEGDRTMLEQALLNLVTNARDAGARRIEVVVEQHAGANEGLTTAHVHGEARGGPFLCVEVRDDGEGMDAELVGRIFDPFFTTRFPGRGLGLAVVSGAVRRHQGLIAVASRPGAGSTFRLCLPVSSEPTRVLVPHALAAPAGPIEPLDVLAVDDEASVRSFVEAALVERGHRVRTLASGEDLRAALAGFRDARRAVLLLDLTMPGQDGRDLVRLARGACPELALVLMSGHSGQAIAETARALGTGAWLQKPFTVAELEAALTRALASPPVPGSTRA